jgi:uncharacterized protein YegJ (DUF2314 family)
MEEIMKRFALIFAAIALCLGLAACDKQSGLQKETRGDETVISVSDEDAAMNAIIEEARQTVSQFLAALKSPQPNQTGFSVKFPFDTDPGSETKVEHIWLADIVEKDGKYMAVVNNDPFYIKKLKLGDKVPVDMTKVSDWMYIEDGYLVGGKSLLYFYDRMNAAEKKQFLDETGLKIRK